MSTQKKQKKKREVVNDESNDDNIEMLKRRYAAWKRKYCLEEFLEVEENLLEEPDALDLERLW